MIMVQNISADRNNNSLEHNIKNKYFLRLLNTCTKE